MVTRSIAPMNIHFPVSAESLSDLHREMLLDDSYTTPFVDDLFELSGKYNYLFHPIQAFTPPLHG